MTDTIFDDSSLLLGKADNGEWQRLPLKWANRHGLITGATGTGKTVSLQVLTEGFSRAGVPVFLADVKGDLTGLCQESAGQDFLQKRADKIGLEPYDSYALPVIFWDLFGKKGHPIRTTISEMGPLLLGRLLDLNETQEGVLAIAFRIADEQGMLLLDIKDLRALLAHIGENAKQIGIDYGHVSTSSIGAIQRRLLMLEDQGGSNFFGEPALDILDLMRTTRNGHGYVNVLAADKLMQTPRLYATSLLWLLAELFEELPEAGDSDRPKLVFFFDEAHLLFREAPKVLLEQVEQVVRLIRSKGVGVYFVTQSPADIPETVLAQLGNKVQHALRAFTPKGQKALRAVADTFRPNPAFDTREVIPELGIGEALVSTLETKAAPSIVQRTLIRPPSSCLGPADEAKVKAVIASSPLASTYDKTVDRESAFEVLKKRAEVKAQDDKTKVHASAPTATPKASGGGFFAKIGELLGGTSRRQGLGEAFTKSIIRAAGSKLGREILRGALGAMAKR